LSINLKLKFNLPTATGY